MLLFSRSLWLISLLALPALSASGQWQIVAQNAVTSGSEWGGALHFRDGIVWAGLNSLVFSTDTGKTWNGTTFYYGEIFDISFLNRDTGIVSSENGVFLTTDRGKDWNEIDRIATTSEYRRIVYNPQDRRIYINLDQDGTCYVSSDNGNNWTSSTLNKYLMGFAISRDGTCYALDSAQVFSSNNNGKSWNRVSPSIELDSYSLDVDSCDANTLYVANEDYVYTSSGPSRVFVSTDRGVTWNAKFSQGPPYLSGAFATSRNAEYALSISDGVTRSTDQGQSWQNIGGPTDVLFDGRNICTIDNNIVFAIDAGGNIWATFNSGGDSLLDSKTGILAEPTSLFSTDTIQCDSITNTVDLRASGCPTPSISGWYFLAGDSTSYRVSNVTNDSVLVTFYGVKNGNNKATLILDVSDGSSDTVMLSGYAHISPQQLSMFTQSVHTDTLGGTVSVPVTISGLEKPENVNIVLHYDGTVDYLGSFAPNGTKLDVAGEEWRGRSLLHIVGAVPNQIAGFAKFNVFNDSSEASIVADASHATFDSMTVLTQTSPCEYSLPPPVTSTITTLSGCAISILSQWIHDTILPTFSIIPNPTSGVIYVSSNLDLGDGQIEVYDMLGMKVVSVEAKILSGNPIEVLLPAMSGVYTVMIRSEAGIEMLRAVEAK